MGTAYYATGTAVQDSSNNINWLAWVTDDGVIETGASACTVTLYQSDKDGTRTAVSGATETVASPESDGVFNGQITVALDAGEMYYFTVSITADASARTGIIPIFVPERTS